MKFYILLLLSLPAFLLSSCSDPLQPAELVGRWKVEEATFTWEGAARKVLAEMAQDAQKQTYYLYKDHTLKVDYGNGKGPRGNARWSLNGTTFTITSPDMLQIDESLARERYTVINFTGKEMTLIGRGPGQSADLRLVRVEE